MALRDFLRDQRGDYVDRSLRAPSGPGIQLDPDDLVELERARRARDLVDPVRGLRRRRVRGGGAGSARSRFRMVKPVFAPSPYADPLPYEERWEQAWR